jgi:hypothetical protein
MVNLYAFSLSCAKNVVPTGKMLSEEVPSVIMIKSYISHRFWTGVERFLSVRWAVRMEKSTNGCHSAQPLRAARLHEMNWSKIGAGSDCQST